MMFLGIIALIGIIAIIIGLNYSDCFKTVFDENGNSKKVIDKDDLGIAIVSTIAIIILIIGIII